MIFYIKFFKLNFVKSCFLYNLGPHNCGILTSNQSKLDSHLRNNTPNAQNYLWSHPTTKISIESSTCDSKLNNVNIDKSKIFTTCNLPKVTTSK